MSAQRRLSPPPPRRRGWLARAVERIQFKRAVITLVALAFVADALLALSLWLGRPITPQEATTWPTPGPAVLEPSPTEPAAGMPTAEPTERPLPNPQPTPSPLPLGPDELNLLLLGTDMRHGPDTSWRTDTIIVVAIRPRLGRVAMLSVPRDLWVSIPSYGVNRINVADNYGERTRGTGGGPALLRATLEQNLGISTQAYARVNFDGLVRIIDALGGVDVTVERNFDEWIDDADGTPPFHLQLTPGQYHMDGRTALNYSRSRHGVNDMDRSKRQQQVLLAMRNAAMRPEVLPRLPGLISALSGTVQTNLSPAQVLSLLKLALQLDSGSYRQKVCDASMVSDWWTSGGAQVLLPDRWRIAEVWKEMTTE